MKRPTQVDVARLAGVSRATVSYVLNGQTKGRVSISAQTQQRVLDAIATLGYQPDAQAQALRTGSTNTIGVIVPDIHNPHFWQYVEGTEQEARDAGYHLLLSISPTNRQTEEESLEDLAQRRIDGLIIQGYYDTTSDSTKKVLKQLKARQLPIVLIGQSILGLDVDVIWADYASATVEAIDYLVGLHHRRIGFIYGVKEPITGEDRLLAYRKNLAKSGLPVDDSLIVNCGPQIEDGYQAAYQLLTRPQRPTAIMVINDLLAIGALRAAADLKIDVPAQLSIVSYDDITLSRYVTPRLTTVSKNPYKIGQKAVQLILERIQAPELPIQKKRMPIRFIVRESTGPAPG